MSKYSGPAIMLRLINGRCFVEVEHDGKWVIILDELGPVISHIVEPLGIQMRIDKARNKQGTGEQT